MNEAELIERFVDALRRDPQAASPIGLDVETAEAIRDLVLSEGKIQLDDALLHKMWHRALSQAQANQTERSPEKRSRDRNRLNLNLRVLKPNEHITIEDDMSTITASLPNSLPAPDTHPPRGRYLWQHTATIAAAIFIVVLVGGLLIEMVNDPLDGYPGAVSLQTEEPKCAAETVTDTTTESLRLSDAAAALLNTKESDRTPEMIEQGALLALCALQTAFTPEADGTLQQAMGIDGAAQSFAGNDNGGVFSPDGRYLLTGDNTVLRLWDVATGNEVREFVGHTGYVLALAFSPDSRYVLSGSEDKTARIWDVETGQEIRQFLHPNTVPIVAFSPDGSHVLSTVGGSYAVYLWDVVTGEETRQFVGHQNEIFGVAFSPDGRYVATSSWDTTVRLWDAATGDELRQFQPFKGFAGMVAFSSDSKYLLNSGAFAVRLSDVETGETIREYTNQRSRVLGYPSFSPDGRYVLASDRDNRLALLWDAETGELVRTFDSHRFDTHAKRMFNVSFSPDGRSIVIGTSSTYGDSLSGRVWIWDTDYHDTIVRACQHVSRDFTPEERSEFGLGEGAACPLKGR